ncbi:thioredoxin domain-containing protein, partial [Klebsiella pneumoniae]|uniref:thioredoxin domain-containing protein n=1 Tax=Klebsiella pneumoniae TaxID=573 RepID=UPI0027308D28
LQLLKLKRNPEVFRHHLTKMPYLKISLKQRMVFGNPAAEITITAFVSMFCSHCLNTLKDIKEIVNNNKQIKAVLVFSIPENDN